MNINLNRNTLVSYHPDTGFKSVEKYQTNYPWVNFIIKCFRYFFHPEFRIANVVDGLKVKARQLSTDQDKFSYIQFVRLFKTQVIDSHNQQAGLFRKAIGTQELDVQLDLLAEEILGTEVAAPLREQLKDYILKDKLPRRDINANTVLNLLQLSKKCKIPELQNFAGGAAIYVLKQLQMSSAPIDLETIKSVLQIYRIGSERIQKEVNEWLDSEKVEALGLYQLVQILKEERPPKLQEICENAFIRRHSQKWPKIIEETTEAENSKVLQQYVLSQSPEDLKIVLDEAIHFGLDQSIDTFFSHLVDYSARLCLEISANKIEKNSEIVERYLKVLQNYALKIQPARPANDLCKMVASLFDGHLWQPEEGQELFKSIISFYLWDRSWNQDSSGNNIYSEASPCHPKSPLRNLTAAENIRLSHKALQFANAFPFLKNYLLNRGLSYHLILNKVEEELHSLADDKKHELIDLMRTQLYPMIPLMSHRFGSFSKRIIAIEQNVRSAPWSIKIFDRHTSDVQFKLANKKIFKLHKQVLRISPYFKALLDDKPDQNVIEHPEENTPVFIALLQYFYHGNLMIDETNAIAMLAMAEKYQIEPLLLVQCHLYTWILSCLSALRDQTKADEISSASWHGLLEFAQKQKDEKLIKNICSYVFLSLNRYAQADSEESGFITEKQFKERKSFLEQHGRLLKSYGEIVIDPSLADFAREFLPNLS